MSIGLYFCAVVIGHDDKFVGTITVIAFVDNGLTTRSGNIGVIVVGEGGVATVFIERKDLLIIYH